MIVDFIDGFKELILFPKYLVNSFIMTVFRKSQVIVHKITLKTLALLGANKNFSKKISLNTIVTEFFGRSICFVVYY